MSVRGSQLLFRDGNASVMTSAGTYVLLSAFQYQCAAQSVTATYLSTPGPQLVTSAFFTRTMWTVQTAGEVYGVASRSNQTSFDVYQRRGKEWVRVARRTGAGKQYRKGGLRVETKVRSLLVDANGWETRATRVRILRSVSAAKWAFDWSMRRTNAASRTDAHGLLGQREDGKPHIASPVGEGRRRPRPTVYAPPSTVEGFLDGGSLSLYAVHGLFSTRFAYSLFGSA